VKEDADDDAELEERLNPNSLEVAQGFVEPGMKGVQIQEKFQFFRHGYFNVDSRYTKDGNIAFNRIVSLKSSFEL
jgi:glutaminyl-tRNA synthetase